MTAAPDGTAAELVVLLDEEGQPCGTAPKASVHHESTPLHLAFSCWLVGEDGRVLLTQRAAGKKTWPLSWTNAFCGHPGPGEAPEDALRRRGRQELGVTVHGVRLVLPDFRYTARMPDGTTENEVCPVFLAATSEPVRPDPDEVHGLAWVEWSQVRTQVETAPDHFSPWLLLQLPLLETQLGR
jgi:isopentenyl-diphosphate delta-isomerase